VAGYSSKLGALLASGSVEASEMERVNILIDQKLAELRQNHRPSPRAWRRSRSGDGSLRSGKRTMVDIRGTLFRVEQQEASSLNGIGYFER
jgi:hypothetical protein